MKKMLAILMALLMAALLDKAELEVVKLMKTADGTPAETEYERDDV